MSVPIAATSTAIVNELGQIIQTIPGTAIIGA